MNESDHISLDENSRDLLERTARLIEAMYGDRWSREEVIRNLTTYAFMRGSYAIATFAREELGKRDELDDERKKLCDRIIGRAIAASAELAETGFVE